MVVKADPDPLGPKLISLDVDIEIDGDAWADESSSIEADCRRCCVTAFNGVQNLGEFDDEGVEACEIAIRLTTDAELQSLNLQFRGMDKPTNVLSFAALDGDGPTIIAGQPLFLGDIAIAGETVAREANEQNKTVSDHLSHMIIHGTLHLLGYEHEDEDEALKMEALERKILSAHHVADPYVAMEQMS